MQFDDYIILLRFFFSRVGCCEYINLYLLLMCVCECGWWFVMLCAHIFKCYSHKAYGLVLRYFCWSSSQFGRSVGWLAGWLVCWFVCVLHHYCYYFIYSLAVALPLFVFSPVAIMLQLDFSIVFDNVYSSFPPFFCRAITSSKQASVCVCVNQIVRTSKASCAHALYRNTFRVYYPFDYRFEALFNFFSLPPSVCAPNSIMSLSLSVCARSLCFPFLLILHSYHACLL